MIKSSENFGHFSTRKMARTPRLPSSAGSRTPSRTGALQTSSISPSFQNCAVADTAQKFCRPSANNTPTHASLSISKSKKIPRTPKNLNAGIVAATFTCATALAPPPLITSGKASTTTYSPQVEPSPTKNSAIFGKKFSKTFPVRNIRKNLQRHFAQSFLNFLNRGHCAFNLFRVEFFQFIFRNADRLRT